jgi:hypothetical protein
MLIRRCVWHRTYHWYPFAIGIASWRGLGVSFTDGMCRGCAVRFRREWNLPAMPAMPSTPVPLFLRVAAPVAVVMVLVLVVLRASEYGRIPATTTPPPETVFVPPVIEGPPSPPIPARPAPRRVGPPARRVPSSTVVATAVRPAATDPDLFADDVESERLVLTSAPDPAVEETKEPYRPSARGTRFYTVSAFAAMPHAGLTQQTP